MDKKYIEENEIEIKYLRNQLTPEEVEEFEVYLMENPEILDSLELQSGFFGLSKDLINLGKIKSLSAHGKLKISIFQKLKGWLMLPIPVYAVLGALVLSAPIFTTELFSKRTEKIELAAFSSSATRSGFGGNPQAFEVLSELGALRNQAAIMIKVTPDVKQSYRLEVSDASSQEKTLIWISEPFVVKSGTRDQIIPLPSSALITKAKIRVLGQEPDGSYKPVKFCHYSEYCR